MRVIPWVVAIWAFACSPKKVELWIGGDVHLGTRVRDAKRLEAIAARFPGAIGVVNLEGPIAESGGPIISSRAALGELRAAGVKVAGLANNHALDLGEAGFAATEVALREEGILPAPAVLEVAGMRIAITAHDLGPVSATGVSPANEASAAIASPSDSRSSRMSPRPANEASPANGASPAIDASTAIDSSAVSRSPGTSPWPAIDAPAGADLWIAGFHVTAPPLYLPEPELRAAAELALARGAAIVVAHGTHSIAPIERRGDRAIAWGLGNLLFDCDCTTESDALVIHVRVEDGRVASVAAVPIEAGLEGRPARPANDPRATFELLRALGSSPIAADGSF